MRRTYLMLKTEKRNETGCPFLITSARHWGAILETGESLIPITAWFAIQNFRRINCANEYAWNRLFSEWTTIVVSMMYRHWPCLCAYSGIAKTDRDFFNTRLLAHPSIMCQLMWVCSQFLFTYHLVSLLSFCTVIGWKY